MALDPRTMKAFMESEMGLPVNSSAKGRFEYWVLMCFLSEVQSSFSDRTYTLVYNNGIRLYTVLSREILKILRDLAHIRTEYARVYTEVVYDRLRE